MSWWNHSHVYCWLCSTPLFAKHENSSFIQGKMKTIHFACDKKRKHQIKAKQRADLIIILRTQQTDKACGFPAAQKPNLRHFICLQTFLCVWLKHPSKIPGGLRQCLVSDSMAVTLIVWDEKMSARHTFSAEGHGSYWWGSDVCRSQVRA